MRIECTMSSDVISQLLDDTLSMKEEDDTTCRKETITKITLIPLSSKVKEKQHMVRKNVSTSLSSKHERNYDKFSAKNVRPHSSSEMVKKSPRFTTPSLSGGVVMPPRPYSANSLKRPITPTFADWRPAPNNWEGRMVSKKWLKNHGLRRKGLLIADALSAVVVVGGEEGRYIGATLYHHGSPVSNFNNNEERMTIRLSDGTSIHVSASDEKLKSYKVRLQRAIQLYQKRLQWLRRSGIRTFGMLVERNVCIIVNTSAPAVRNNLDYVKHEVCKLLEDVTDSESLFNIICYHKSVEMFSNSLLSIEKRNDGLNWLQGISAGQGWDLVGALSASLADERIEGIYLLGCNDPADDPSISLEQILELLKRRPHVKIHVSEFMDPDFDTSGTSILGALSMQTHGRHQILCDGPLARSDDIDLIVSEIAVARDFLSKVHDLLERRQDLVSDNKNNDVGLNEKVSSKTWLLKKGLRGRRLTIYDFLAPFVFDHAEGTIQLPNTENVREMTYGLCTKEGQHSGTVKKRVGAKYCDDWVHLEWRDASLKHVFFNDVNLYEYETAIKDLISDCEQRIKWLQQGSRHVFGVLLESRVCIVVDTSQSMENGMDYLRENLQLLLEEQLKNKKEFNLIQFNSVITAFHPDLVDVSPGTLQDAEEWVRNLEPCGSTDTKGALKAAFACRGVEGIYLLSDGRPNDGTEEILEYVLQVNRGGRVRIHTISFNCANPEANDFLRELASMSGGRFHNARDPSMNNKSDNDSIISNENVDKRRILRSEDLLVLREEIVKAKISLKKARLLRKEIAGKESRIMFLGQSVQKQVGLPDSNKIESSFRCSASSKPGDLKRETGWCQSTKIDRTITGKATYAKALEDAEAVTSGSSYIDSERTEDRKFTRYKRPSYLAFETLTSNNKTLHEDDVKITLISGEKTPESIETSSKHKQKANSESNNKRNERSVKYKTVRVVRTKDEARMSSVEWLMRHGLGAQNLSILDILESSSSHHQAVELPSTGSLVYAKYWMDIFLYYQLKNGEFRSINSGILKRFPNYEQKLYAARTRFTDRLNWLKTPGRRLLGVIMERRIAIVIGVNKSHIRMVQDELIDALCNLLCRSRNDRVAFVRYATSDLNCSEDVVPYIHHTSKSNIDATVDWIMDWSVEDMCPSLITTLEATLKCNMQAIYLIASESLHDSKQVRSIINNYHRESNKKSRIRLHTVSFETTDSLHNHTLRELAHSFQGRFNVATRIGEALCGDDANCLQEEISLTKTYSEQARLLEQVNEKQPIYSLKVITNEPAIVALHQAATADPRIDVELKSTLDFQQLLDAIREVLLNYDFESIEADPTLERLTRMRDALMRGGRFISIKILPLQVSREKNSTEETAREVLLELIWGGCGGGAPYFIDGICMINPRRRKKRLGVTRVIKICKKKKNISKLRDLKDDDNDDEGEDINSIDVDDNEEVEEQEDKEMDAEIEEDEKDDDSNENFDLDTNIYMNSKRPKSARQLRTPCTPIHSNNDNSDTTELKKNVSFNPNLTQEHVISVEGESSTPTGLLEDNDVSV